MPWYLLYDSAGVVRQTGFIDETLLGPLREYTTANGVIGVTGPQIMAIAELPLPIELLTTLTYVDDGVLRQRIAIEAVVSTFDIAADGIDEADITGLPIPCTVTISGALSVDAFELVDGSLTITSDAIGDILITIDAAPPYLSLSMTIHAT